MQFTKLQCAKKNWCLTLNSYVVKCLCFLTCFLSHLIWGYLSIQSEADKMLYEGQTSGGAGGANTSLEVQTWDGALWHGPVLESLGPLGQREGESEVGSRHRTRCFSCHFLVLCSIYWIMLMSYRVLVIIDDFRSFTEDTLRVSATPSEKEGLLR